MFVLLAIGYQLLTTNVVYAQNAQTVQINTKNEWYKPNFIDRGKALDSAKGKANAEATYGFGVRNLIMAVGTEISGYEGNEKNRRQLETNIERSPLGSVSSYVFALYQTPAATTSEYFADVFNRAGIVPKTYAQGISYSRLLPLLPIWKILRDFSYLCLSIVMLIIGVMIMFRHKVNAQTVANIENTIPNLLKTIILITFSFPIGAFMIDIMYVGIAAGVGLIGTAVKDPNLVTAIYSYTSGGILSLIANTFAPLANMINPSSSAGAVTGFGGVVGIAATGAASLFPVIGVIVAMVIAGIGFGLPNSGIDPNIIIANAASPFVLLMVFLVLLFSISRVFFMLLYSYIQIILYIVFSPILLIFNAIPGQDTFTNWWKNIAMNLSSFIVTAVIMYLAWAITYIMKDSRQTLWTAPFIINFVGASQMATGLVSLAFVITLPEWIKKVRGMFNVKPIIQVGPSTLLNPVTSSASSIMGLGSSLASWQKVFETDGIASTIKKKITGK